jgi:hypothetical protein
MLLFSDPEKQNMKSNIGYMKTGTVRPAVLYSIYMFNNIYTFCKNSILSIINIYVSILNNIESNVFSGIAVTCEVV